MGITTVIDLRSKEEIEKKHGVFYQNTDFEYYNITVKGDGKVPETKEKVVDSYIDMLQGKEQIRQIFEIIQKSKGGIIYYCNAGKDRTGVITTLILKLLNVNTQDIITDYLASGKFLKESLEEFVKKEKNKNILQIITPNKTNIQGVLKYIDQEYGSIENYLQSCKISKECLNQIKEKMLI